MGGPLKEPAPKNILNKVSSPISRGKHIGTRARVRQGKQGWMETSGNELTKYSVNSFRNEGDKMMIEVLWSKDETMWEPEKNMPEDAPEDVVALCAKLQVEELKKMSRMIRYNKKRPLV